jgi:transposase
MNYVGIDWAYRRAAWCALSETGAIEGEGMIPADGDGLARLVLELGTEIRACVETMSGSVWVKDQLEACGWSVEVANAGKVRDIAPLACKTDKIDARVLAELCRRDLVPAVWVASLEDRAIRERLRRRAHLVKLRTSHRNRIFGLLTQFGLRISFTRLRQPDGLELLERRGVPAVWRDWISGHDVARFSSAAKLVGYAGLAPRIIQSGERSQTGRLSKAGSRTLRWAAVEAANQAWRPTNPFHEHYRRLAARHGTNPAKVSVARKLLICSWHMLSRDQVFQLPRTINDAAASSLPLSGRLDGPAWN